MSATSVICLCLCAVLAAICADQRRTINRMLSQQFIERQRLQSKCDALTEAVVRANGQQLDLNKAGRAAFASLVKQRSPFNFKRDLPATPPKESA